VGPLSSPSTGRARSRAGARASRWRPPSPGWPRPSGGPPARGRRRRRDFGARGRKTGRARASAPTPGSPGRAGDRRAGCRVVGRPRVLRIGGHRPLQDRDLLDAEGEAVVGREDTPAPVPGRGRFDVALPLVQPAECVGHHRVGLGVGGRQAGEKDGDSVVQEAGPGVLVRGLEGVGVLAQGFAAAASAHRRPRPPVGGPRPRGRAGARGPRRGRADRSRGRGRPSRGGVGPARAPEEGGGERQGGGVARLRLERAVEERQGARRLSPGRLEPRLLGAAAAVNAGSSPPRRRPRGQRRSSAGGESEAQGVLRLAAPRPRVVRAEAGDGGREPLLGVLRAGRAGERGDRRRCSSGRRRGRAAGPRDSTPRGRSTGCGTARGGDRRGPAPPPSGPARSRGRCVAGRLGRPWARAFLVRHELLTLGGVEARRSVSSRIPAGSATSRAKGAWGATSAVVSKTTSSPAVRRTRAPGRDEVAFVAIRALPPVTSRLSAPSRFAAFTRPARAPGTSSG